MPKTNRTQPAASSPPPPPLADTQSVVIVPPPQARPTPPAVAVSPSKLTGMEDALRQKDERIAELVAFLKKSVKEGVLNYSEASELIAKG